MGVALRDILTPYKHQADPDSLRGIAAIDAYNALYQFLSIIRQPDGTPLMDKGGRVTSHLSGIFFRTTNFLEQGIQPVWIFDGKPPELKSRTIQERRTLREGAEVKWEQAKRDGDTEGAFKHAMASSRLDDAILSSSRELLSLLGIPVIDAPSEGEAQASHMVRTGEVSYVASQDYDTLLFGAPLLVRNLTVSGKRRLHGRMVNVQPEIVRLDEVLSGLGLTREELIDLAILVGTDFNEGVPGVGAKTALKKMKNGEFNEVLASKLPDFDPDPVRELFLHPPVSGSNTLEWKKPVY
ncbi:MAG: flap endonuclease-1, partial [Methanomicrobiales archaeon HGW-Methanomicrobiales-4]